MNKLWEKIFQYALAALVVIAFFVVIVLMIIHSDKLQGANDVLYAMVGILGAMVMAVIGYFFGSSKGSSDKTDMLKKNESVE